MQYFIYIYFILLLLLYYELLGQAVSKFFKISFNSLYLPLGFTTTQAFSYFFTSIISFLNLNTIFYYFVQTLLLLLSIVFIIKTEEYNRYKFKPWKLFFIILSTMFLLFYSYDTTLGDLNGFDTTYYLNLISQNIGIKEMNSTNPIWGFYKQGSIEDLYSFQTYFYSASFLLFIFQKIASFLKISFYPVIQFIWLFQTLFFILLSNIVCESIDIFNKNKERLSLYIVSFAILILFFGRYQYNNVYGFFGNTLRTVIQAYSCLFVYNYFKTNNTNFKYLIYLFILCSCSLSSTGAFISVLFMFALFFILNSSDKNILKEYAIVLFPIFTNLIQYTLKRNIVVSICLSILICSLLFIFNKTLISLIKKYKKLLLILIFVFMFVMSYQTTKNIFDFSGFFSRTGRTYDMVLYFFNFSLKKGFNVTNVYIIYCDLIVLFNLLFKRKDKLMTIAWILIICFFNPFCCNFLSKVNTVYYRAYEIILNPFTIIYMTNNIFEMIDNKAINYSISIIVLLVIAYTANLSKPMYYHESYIPSKDYNGFYRMNNDEIDVINELKVYCLDKDNPRIITPNLLTQSMLQKGTYIFGRSLQVNPDWTDAEKELYAIFYPAIYYGDPDQPANPDYDNYESYLKEADIDYVVVDKSLMHYYPEEDNYYGLYYYLLRIGRDINVLYDNNSYLIISVDK